MNGNKRIAVLGSLNMDLTIQCDRIPESGETLLGHGFLMNEGGKGGNQAVAAAKQGSDVYFLGAVGNDLFGERMKAALERVKINTDYIQNIDDVMTGVAAIIISENDNRIILDSGANYKIDVDIVKENLNKEGREGDIFITQFEVSPFCVSECLKKAKELNMFTLLNPAPARKIDKEIYPYIDIIVVNQSECEILTGIYPNNEEDCKNAFQKLREYGIKIIIITLGTKGSYGIEGEKQIFMPAYKVECVDTTSAGDTYIGAFASKWIDGCSLEGSMKYATKAAALTVMRAGAQSSIPYKEEVLNSIKEDEENE